MGDAERQEGGRPRCRDRESDRCPARSGTDPGGGRARPLMLAWLRTTVAGATSAGRPRRSRSPALRWTVWWRGRRPIGSICIGRSPRWLVCSVPADRSGSSGTGSTRRAPGSSSWWQFSGRRMRAVSGTGWTSALPEGGFQRPVRQSWRFRQRLDRSVLIDLVASRSYVMRLDEKAQRIARQSRIPRTGTGPLRTAVYVRGLAGVSTGVTGFSPPMSSRSCHCHNL